MLSPLFTIQVDGVVLSASSKITRSEVTEVMDLLAGDLIRVPVSWCLA